MHRRSVQRRGAATLERAVPRRTPRRSDHRRAGVGDGVGGARRHRGHAGDRHEPRVVPRRPRRSSRYERVKRYFAERATVAACSPPRTPTPGRATRCPTPSFMPNPLHVTPGRCPDLHRAGGRAARAAVLREGPGHDAGGVGGGAARYPEWRLRLYGSGPEEEALRRQAEELGVSAPWSSAARPPTSRAPERSVDLRAVLAGGGLPDVDHGGDGVRSADGGVRLRAGRATS